MLNSMIMTKDVLLTYSFTESNFEKGLLDYSVQNNSDSSIALFSTLYDLDDPFMHANQNYCYAFWHDDFTLHLTKRLWPSSLNSSIARPEIPYVQIVEKGETFEESLSLSLPVSIQHPFQKREQNYRKEKNEKAFIPSRLSRLFTFSIGYYPLKEEEFIPPAMQPDQKLIDLYDDIQKLPKAKQAKALKTKMAVYKEEKKASDIKPYTGLYQPHYFTAIKKQKILRGDPIEMQTLAVEKNHLE